MAIYPGDTIEKDPQSVRFLPFDWTTYLATTSETILSSAWTIAGPDAALTADQDAIWGANLKTKVRLSGGTIGAVYTVTNRITTSGSPSQIDDRSVSVKIVQQ